jgi:hypothetical protein
MKSILDPSFRYTPSFQTDVRKTFERIRMERADQGRAVALSTQGAGENVRRLDPRKAASK